jgi:hypothetical protein
MKIAGFSVGNKAYVTNFAFQAEASVILIDISLPVRSFKNVNAGVLRQS